MKLETIVQEAPLAVHVDDRRPTLAAVAELAGVSLKTASRAINGERYVAEQTRVRVLDAASTLGFQLNAMASLLKRGVTSNVVALITGDLANPFYSSIAKGVEREIRSHDLQLTIASSDESFKAEQAIVDEFLARQVRALIMVSTLESQEYLAPVIARGVNVVFLDRTAVGVQADSFVLDNYTGVRSAIEQLLSLGHRRIGYVGDFARLQTHQTRFSAFRDAMVEAGVDNWAEFAVEGAHDAASANRVVGGLLRRERPPTAIFTSNNQMTIGAVRAISMTAPQTALIGFDDFELSDVLGITTVSHNPMEMGRLAARAILAAQSNQKTEPRERVLPTRLVRRGSGERRPVAY